MIAGATRALTNARVTAPPTYFLCCIGMTNDTCACCGCRKTTLPNEPNQPFARRFDRAGHARTRASPRRCADRFK
ncbi:hypothetical protein [Lysobacter gummosus]|uniref:hypothetical protein n=1 Tax=Lysobacter gummosus TaxID=262324 RepID=UPI00362CD44D